MPRPLTLLLGALACAVLIALVTAIACDGDDNDDGDDPTTTPSASINPTDEPDESPDGAASPTADDKTPGPGETTDPNATDPPGPGGATPADRGIRAVFIDDPSTWFVQNYPGVSPGQENCDYSLVDVIVTCSGVEYAPDPPPVGAGAECFGLLVNNERVALRCNIPDVTTYYYDIQE